MHFRSVKHLKTSKKFPPAAGLFSSLEYISEVQITLKPPKFSACGGLIFFLSYVLCNDKCNGTIMRSYARNFILCNGTSAFLYWWNRSVTLVRTKFSFSAMTEAPSCIGEMIQQCVYAVQVLCNNNSTVEFK